MYEDDEVLKEFLVESYENLDRIDTELVDLEQDPTNGEILSSIFRTLHTLKGTCGFLAFHKLEALAHAGENLLSKLRDGKLHLHAGMTSALLATMDAVREMLNHLESEGSEGDGDYSELVATLRSLAEGAPEASPEAGEKKVATPSSTPGETAKPVAGASASESNIRVDVNLLDKLMNLVGELVLARNQILQYSAGQSDSELGRTTQRLNLITTELQEGIMKTRMQPIGGTWRKLPRVVRDLSLSCGKQVRLEMSGKNTELDRTIIEAIKDPLVHLVRNSVDHGIETPDVRKAAGKPEEGTLSLRAFHEGGQVNIEISDDGKGIDVDRVKDKAVREGVLTAEAVNRMSDREAMHLIFHAGLSTAKKVTNVSGRGVGMDVVKTNIEKIGGTIDLTSEPGRGTTIRIKIPLTLAIIPALIVQGSDERYAIPQVSLVELVRLEGQSSLGRIEHIRGTPVYRLRGELLPIVHLDEVLNMPRPPEDEDRAINIVVLQADGKQFGLVVDAIHDTEEIVVKPLGRQIKNLNVFAGATIMGDGQVALILDVLGLAQRARVVSDLRESTRADDKRHKSGHSEDTQTLLILGVGRDRRMAIPLSMVSRLEEFHRDKIERAGDQQVVQYRDRIMPLVRLGDALGARDTSGDADLLQVVVYSENDTRVGVVVDTIFDIVKERLDPRHREAGTKGRTTAVVQDKVTEILDIRSIIRNVDPSLVEESLGA